MKIFVTTMSPCIVKSKNYLVYLFQQNQEAVTQKGSEKRFPGKQLYQSLFFNKVEGLLRRSCIPVKQLQEKKFLKYCKRIFSEQLFYRIPTFFYRTFTSYT